LQSTKAGEFIKGFQNGIPECAVADTDVYRTARRLCRAGERFDESLFAHQRILWLKTSRTSLPAIKSQKYNQLKKECLWLKQHNKLTIIGIYVDKEISTTLGSSFKMKHLGELNEFLGIEAMSKSYEPNENSEKRDEYPIRQAIRCLLYLANATRPDITSRSTMSADTSRNPPKTMEGNSTHCRISKNNIRS
jgi:hypothetical protein